MTIMPMKHLTFLLATALAAVSASAANIVLQWDDHSTNETAFVVEQQVDGAAWASIGTTAANVETYTTAPKAGSVNAYRVKATNQWGSSGYSNVVTVDARPPTAPGNLKLGPVAAGIAALIAGLATWRKGKR